ncbi:MAG: hypothetical protein ACOCZE_04050 [Planctomycetota bacterium]
MQSVNLIPAPRRKAQSRARKLRRYGCFCALYAGVLVAIYAFCYSAWGGRAVPIASEMRRVSTRIKSVGDEIRRLKAQIQADRLKLAANHAVSNQPDWSLLLFSMSNSIDETIVLRRILLKPAEQTDAEGRAVPVDVTSMPPELASGRVGTYQLEVSGWAGDQAAVWDLALQLERTGLFETVKVADSRGEVFMNRSSTGFALLCRLATSAGDGP